MTRRMAGDPEVLRLLAADRDRLYQRGELTDDDLGTPGYNEDYSPDEQRAAIEEDSGNPNYEYVVDPHGYGVYQYRADDAPVKVVSEEEKAERQAQANAYMDRLMAGLLQREEDDLAAAIEAKGYSPEDARLMAVKYMSGEGAP